MAQAIRCDTGRDGFRVTADDSKLELEVPKFTQAGSPGPGSPASGLESTWSPGLEVKKFGALASDGVNFESLNFQRRRDY